MSKLVSSRRTQVCYGDNLQGEIQINEDNMTLLLYEIKPGSKPGNRKNQVIDYFNISSSLSFSVNPLTLQIKFYTVNNDNNFEFKFLSEIDLSKFIHKISGNIQITQSDVNPHRYLLGSIDFGESQFNSTFLPKVKNNSEMNRLTNVNDILKQSVQEDDEVTEISESNTDFYNKNWNEKITFKAFQLRYPKSSDMLDYDTISKQWKLLTDDQIKNQSKICSIMSELEDDILKSDSFFNAFNEEAKFKFQKIAFDVMLSYTYFNFDGASYFSREIDLLYPLMSAYIAQYGIDCDSAQCEADLFYLYDSFYRSGMFNELKTNKMQSFIMEMIIKLGHQLSDKFPKVIQFLESKNVFSLDFFIKDISWWFINSFSMKDIHRLWLSIPQFQSLDVFFSCFITAILISISQEMKDYYPINQMEFLKFYRQVIYKIPMKNLLYYAKLIEPMFFPPQQST